ncbi:MAG: metallophosphoesterase [Chitinophagaceae bacterium]
MKKFTLTLFPILVAASIMTNRVPGSLQRVAGDTLPYDGPYVFYSNDQVFVKYVLDNGGVKSVKTDSMPLSQRSAISLVVATDEPGKSFSFPLKKELENEKAEYPGVSKQFILSDIEGNFKAFRKLLQAGGVIDDNFNWTFGAGHLVLTGDFFDRGTQVTEVLWLIYSLEDKAKAAGGYVHFVLGNHEIMNLSGDIRYVQPKYIESGILVKENYMMLYNEQSELGRWLRTKNIMEKVGDILFMHGGVSPTMNSMNIPVSTLSTMARPYYADSTFKYPDPRLDTIYSNLGPFWYRGFYTGDPRAGSTDIDNTLSLYGVKHIATGHTVIADTISVLYKGKVFNTDVHHAGGHSEALFLESGKFYRVSGLGEKFLIL